jgi:hypothetical protein
VLSDEQNATQLPTGPSQCLVETGGLGAQYRTSIALLPDTEIRNAFKHLCVLLQRRNGSAEEIVSLWQHFLRLMPNDPDAAAIRQQIQALGGTP